MEMLITEEKFNEMREVLNTLTPRERKVLILRFGIDDGRAKTLKEVGKMFGLSPDRIRQIQKSALMKLK